MNTSQKTDTTLEKSNKTKNNNHWLIIEPVKRQIYIAMAINVFSVIMSLISICLLAYLIKIVINTHSIQWEYFGYLLLVIFTAFITRGISFKQSHLSAFALEVILRKQIITHLAKLPLGAIQSFGSAELSKVIHDDVRELHVFVADATPLYARLITAPLLSFILVLWFDWRLGLTAVAILIGGMLALSLAMKGSKDINQQYNEAREDVSRSVVEFVQAMPIVRTFDDGKFSFKRYETALDNYRDIVIRWFKSHGSAARLSMVILNPLPTLVALLWVGDYLIYSGNLDFSTWIAVLLLGTGMAEAIMPYMGLYHMVEKSKVSIERINQVLNLTPLTNKHIQQESLDSSKVFTNNIKPFSKQVFPKDSSIRFESVNFCYPNRDNNALSDISFYIPEGSFTALVGSSGAGKSTVAQLISRFWDVKSGKVLVGGIDVRDMDVEVLMQHVAFVFQDTFLFSGNILDNIRLGQESKSLEEVINACKSAQVHEFIEALPNGYKTNVGERGVSLSGGERQRITIARAILQNRPILVLDEATAFADAENEDLLMKALQKLMQGKTVLMIAHRLATIKNADQILVFQNGHLVESGKANELLALNGTYHKMWNTWQQTQDWKIGTNQFHKKNDSNEDISSKKYEDSFITQDIPNPTHIQNQQILPEEYNSLSLPKLLSHMFSVAGENNSSIMRRCLYLGIVTAVLRGIAFILFAPLFFATFSNDWRQVWLLLIIFTILMVISSVTDWFSRDFDYNGHATLMGDSIRRQLGIHLRNLPLEVLYSKRTGEINATVAGEVDEVINFNMNVLLMLINAIILPTTVSIGMMYFDWRIGLALLLVFPLSLPIYFIVQPLLNKNKQQLADAHAILQAETLEYTQGLAVLKSAGCIGDKHNRFMIAAKSVELHQISGMKSIAPANILLGSIIEIGMVLVIGLALLLATGGSTDFIILAALSVVIMRFAEPLSVFISMMSIFEMVNIGYQRLSALLSIKPLPQLSPVQVPTSYDVCFEKVDFHYSTSVQSHPQYALKNINLHIPQQGLTALTGCSGCGKTTLIRMLMRYADPQSGIIKIGGIDIRHIKPDALYCLIAVVFQEVYLFDDSILDNIRMGRPDATNEEVYAVAKKAYCHEFIQRLPEGYNTKVGDIGSNLSGGEKQRISIARALLKDAPIVILDEPTASLDTQSELVVQQAIDTLVKNKTVIVIAHRLSTIVAANQIVVMDSGQIIETGTHEQLINNNNTYAKLWQIQQNNVDNPQT